MQALLIGGAVVLVLALVLLNVVIHLAKKVGEGAAVKELAKAAEQTLKLAAERKRIADEIARQAVADEAAWVVDQRRAARIRLRRKLGCDGYCLGDTAE